MEVLIINSNILEVYSAASTDNNSGFDIENVVANTEY